MLSSGLHLLSVILTAVVYMNAFSYLADDAKKARKRRKLNVANEKENSDASKPQEKLQIETKFSNSDSSKINIKAKKFALQLRQKNCIKKTPTEIIDADAHVPKDVKPLLPWVVGLSQDDRRLVAEGEWLNDKLITAFLSNSFLTFLVFKMSPWARLSALKLSSLSLSKSSTQVAVTG